MYNVDTFDQYIDKIVDYIKKNPPTCNDEFKLYTKIFYGVELSCDYNGYVGDEYGHGSYKVKEDQCNYSKCLLYRCWSKKFGHYDELRVLLNETFGELYCGGVAGSHYGQFEMTREKYYSLIDWDEPMDDLHKYLKEIELLELVDSLPRYN
jgi:hypothetical protein